MLSRDPREELCWSGLAYELEKRMIHFPFETLCSGHAVDNARTDRSRDGRSIPGPERIARYSANLRFINKATTDGSAVLGAVLPRHPIVPGDLSRLV